MASHFQTLDPPTENACPPPAQGKRAVTALITQAVLLPSSCHAGGAVLCSDPNRPQRLGFYHLPLPYCGPEFKEGKNPPSHVPDRRHHGAVPSTPATSELALNL